MVRHLGFEIPLSITIKEGRQHSGPSRGVCAFCLKRQPKVYVLGDDRRICDACIETTYAARGHGLGGQRHPDLSPVEMPYGELRKAGLTDRFNTDFWDKALK